MRHGEFMVTTDKVAARHGVPLQKILLFTLLWSLCCLATARAQSTPTADQVNAIAHKLFCPTCQAIPVDQCTTTVCEQWRATIAQMLQEGRTESEIYDTFARQYGEQVLTIPPTQGKYIFLWAVPPAALLLGALLYLRYFKGSRIKPTPITIPESLKPYQARLEAQLEQEE